MNQIVKIEGAVFYVDILGMSPLTNNELTLSEDDFNPWLIGYDNEHTNQILAASILATFRSILIDLGPEFQNVTISQLSDCAFAWSENISDILIFSTRFMTSAIRNGILCRSGIAFGEIIETNQNHKLGRFIVGKAVTKAANLEKVTKGARIAIDPDLPSKLWNQDQTFSQNTLPMFNPIINPLDFSELDEFKWYLCPDLELNSPNLTTLNDVQKINLTKQRLKIANQVMCSPKFRWNSRSSHGLVQLKATINFISENNLFGVHHNFEWKTTDHKRSINDVEVVNQLIDRDNYSLIK